MKTWIFSAVIAAALVSGVYALADSVFAAIPMPQITEGRPLPPDTSIPEVSHPSRTTTQPKKPSSKNPAQIVIPSINLDAPVVPMGMNQKGELDVPDGRTSNVGWWNAGPVPGEMGTAVLDAHVFAAFSNLKYAQIGSDIYVVMSDGEVKHFVIQDTRVFKLQDLTSEMLFGNKGYRGLNLITCSGVFDTALDTYTHRLVVFTKLAQE